MKMYCLLLLFMPWLEAAGIDSNNSSAGQLKLAAIPLKDLPEFKEQSADVMWLSASPGGILVISMYNGMDNPGQDPGVLFTYNINTKELRRCIDFSGPDGFQPNGKMTCGPESRVMYGVTYRGGENDLGTIYSLDVVTGKHELIYSFAEGGPILPVFGLLAINNFQFVGISTTSDVESSSPAEPNDANKCDGAPYLYDSRTKTATVLDPAPECGSVLGLPVLLNPNTLVFLYRNSGKKTIVEYSIKDKKVISKVSIDFWFTPISPLVRGKDSCLYVMNYTSKANSASYLFLRYDTRTKTCKQTAGGSRLRSMYSSDFTTDGSGNLYGFFVFGAGEIPEGVAYRYYPATDTIEPYLGLTAIKDTSNSNGEETIANSLRPSSNTVFGSDGKLYVMTLDRGLLCVDPNTKEIVQLAKN